MRPFLLIVAAWASIATVTAFFLDQNAVAPFVIAVLCLAGFFWLDYRAAQRARADRWEHPIDLSDWDCPEDAVYDGLDR
jgi:hypothetical protein